MSALTLWYPVHTLKPVSVWNAPTKTWLIELGHCFAQAHSLMWRTGQVPTSFSGARISLHPPPKRKMKQLLCWCLQSRNRSMSTEYTQCRTASWGGTLAQGLFLFVLCRNSLLFNATEPQGRCNVKDAELQWCAVFLTALSMPDAKNSRRELIWYCLRICYHWRPHGWFGGELSLHLPLSASLSFLVVCALVEAICLSDWEN